MAETAEAANDAEKVNTGVGSKELTRRHASRELVFGIVGHVGSGTSTVADNLRDILAAQSIEGVSYQCENIRAREVIEEWADQAGEHYPKERPFTISNVERFQDLGDMMRSSGDHAAVAKGAIRRIRNKRAEFQNIQVSDDDPVVPDGQPRAYILDSVRHPAEVELLRRLYGDAFVLIGVVCEESVRRQRISEKYRDAGLDAAEAFMERDAKAAEKHGQRVSDAFHLSDFFIDNTAQRFIQNDPGRPNPKWDINDHLLRLIRVVSHDQIERPHIDETAMFAAAGAAMRSACLSRQVGAAILDSKGNVVATGANEVPKAGGGVYGDVFGNPSFDDRCFVNKKYCSNTKEQLEIAETIVSDLSGSLSGNVDRAELVKALKSGRVGELLEFSRAVHAEMDALLAAGRKGTSTVGCRVYVTTFPCHYCARHIVSAGVDEVQFIEPYPKSKAFDLHNDSILNDRTKEDWSPPSQGGSKVLFRPFTGVAPRMYRRAFQKDRDLKNGETGELTISPPEWGSPYDISKVSYADFEVSLIKDIGL